MSVTVEARRIEQRMLQRRNGVVLNRISQVVFALAGILVLYVVGRAAAANLGVFFQQVLNGFQLGFIYALIALGYTMVYGIVKLINFAHGDVFMVGAFVSFFTISLLNLHQWPLAVWPGMNPTAAMVIGTVTVILASMLTCALLAVTMERFAYRPLRAMPRIAALITAIGVSFFLEYFGGLPFVFTNNYITYPRPFEVFVLNADMVPPLWLGILWGMCGIAAIVYGILKVLGNRGNARAQAWQRNPFLQFGMLFGGFLGVALTIIWLTPRLVRTHFDLTASNAMLIIMGISVILLVILQYIVRYTRIGKAMRASAYDKPTSRLMGINVDMVIAATFALAGSLAGAGGVLYATAYNRIHHLMGIIPGLKSFVAAVIGGIGSIPGAFVGALTIGLVEVLSAGFISSPMRDAVAFSLLIIVLLIRPQGIFGEAPGEKV
ncbi:MAG: branched-chain amino acid ABC transporter permease [Thermoflexales bacterium]|nr:branched-chain amino acid ABC transporter permease [Thermoflexales bacterium]